MSESEPSHVVVTGAAGFIGSAFARNYLAWHPAARVTVVDKLTYAGNRANLAPVEHDPRFRFVQADIVDYDAVAPVVAGADAVVNFAAESVAADTYLPVHDGHGIKLVTAEELFAASAAKRGSSTDGRGVEVVEPRLPLFALAFRNGMGQWRRITHITRHHLRGTMVTLRQKWGSVTVTPNHSVYDAGAQLVAAGSNPELLAMRKINVDRSRHRHHLKINLPGINAAEGRLYAPTADGRRRARNAYVDQALQGKELVAFMHFLGAYVAEGNSLYNKTTGGWQVCIANCDLKFLEQCQRDAALFTDVQGSITRRERPHAHQLVFNSRILYLVLSTLCGARSYEKRVPDALYTLSTEYKRAFLESYLRGDGNVQRNKTVDTPRLTTTSGRLAAGIGLLLSLMGQDYSVSYRELEENQVWRPAHTLNLVSSYDYRAERTIEERPYDGFVYDLTVDGAHNYAAGIGNVVVHNTHVDRSIQDPDVFVRTNYVGVHTLLRAARVGGVRRFLLVSTDEVYGHVGEGATREDAPLRPRNPYSASKAGAELLALSYWTNFGLPVLVTRGANTIGPYQYPEKATPLFITNALEDKPLPIYGQGKAVRHYLYVDDHAAAIDLVLQRGVPGEAYNIGSEDEIDTVTLATRILDLLGKPHALMRLVPDRPAHDYRYSLDSAKIHALGWRRRFAWEETIEATVAWYVERPDWWRPLKAGDYQEYYRRQYGTILAGT